jgi:lipoprotein-releasing system permease protein
MSVVVELALLLSRAARSRWLLNRSIGLNVIAIASGVAFLGFALSVYDGYRNKVERIIFTLTSHVAVRPGVKPGGDASATDDNSEMARCVKACRAPSAVHIPVDAKKRMTSAFDAEKVRAVADWLAANAPPGTGASRVLNEEVKLDIRAGRFVTEAPRAMRVLGVGMLYGDLPSPRIDLTFSDSAVGERFRRGDSILISDVLASEIAQADGAAIVPGRSTIWIGRAGAQREVPVAGIHRIGINAISRNLIIAPYQLAAELIGDDAKEGPTYVGLTLADAGSAREVRNDLSTSIAAEGLRTVAWQTIGDQFKQLELYRWIIIVTLALSIVVTSINTFVNINILIMERIEHIGIMRAMGLSPRRLLTVFLAIGVFQSILGTTLGYSVGVLAGYGLDDYINTLVRDFIPITGATISPNPLAYALILAFVTCVSVVACVLAGRRALTSAIYKNLRGV